MMNILKRMVENITYKLYNNLYMEDKIYIEDELVKVFMFHEYSKELNNIVDIDKLTEFHERLIFIINIVKKNPPSDYLKMKNHIEILKHNKAGVNSFKIKINKNIRILADITADRISKRKII